MKRPVLLVALATSALLLAACGGASPTTPAAAASAAGATAAGGTSAQFGGDVCTALTKADIEGGTYGQGTAVFDSTDTQKDPTTGAAVVCQYLVKFGSNPSTVAAVVTLLDSTEYATHTKASIVASEVSLPGIGSEAWLVASAPGLLEVWVKGAHGDFSVAAQTKSTVIALATVAAGRD